MLELTLQQKKQLFEEHQRRKRENENATQAALAGWARDTFRLDCVPNQSTIGRIIKNGSAFSRHGPALPTNVKRKRKAAAPRLENALYKWLCEMNNNGVLLSGEVIKIKAQRLLDHANMHLSEDEKLSMKFSKGWLERFKKRHSLRFRRVHGEAQSADTDAIRDEMPRILEIVNSFAEKDVWNADEFGLFFRQPPSWTLASGAVSGCKKEKNRLTFLACCNKDGSEKMPLMVIGNAERPRAFKKHTGQQLGLDYHFNRKAWMTQDLFFEWLSRLDRYIGDTQGRKILLLVDNCSAHGKKHNVPDLQNVRVEFLPPNTTRKVQPLDAGVIAWVKGQYKRRLLLRVFENLEANSKNIYSVDVLTAIRWTEREWKRCSADVIKNCFTHCFKQCGHETTSDSCYDEEETLQSRARDAQEYGVEVSNASLANMLHPHGEDDVTESVSLDELAREVADVSDAVQDHDEVEQDITEQLPSVEGQLNALTMARAILDSHGMLSEETSKALFKCQRAINVEKTRHMNQTTIEDHFTKK